MPAAVAGVPAVATVKRVLADGTLQDAELHAIATAKRVLPDGSLQDAELHGTTTESFVNGFAVFSDLTLYNVGTFNLIFTSTEYGVSIRDEFRGTKVRANAFQTLSVLRHPGNATAAVSLSSQVQVELLDAYSNRLTCEYGECPSSLFGYPSSVERRGWSLAPQSDLVVTARVQALGASAEEGASDTCTARSADPDCGCGDHVAFSSRGMGVFECISVGAAAPAYVLSLSAGASVVHTHPFTIKPGKLASLFMGRQPGRLAQAGEFVTPAPEVFLLDKCGNHIVDDVFLLDKCGNHIVDDVPGVFLSAGVDATRKAGLFGLLSAAPVRGIATFHQLRYEG
ncbi:hypothetical protein T484DRAFT_1783415 [Baffinella frigidus]|nr:hypothetical protein T484DRAFT_1783415 [Cryptophyta sp. CCMP2293]